MRLVWVLLAGSLFSLLSGCSGRLATQEAHDPCGSFRSAFSSVSAIFQVDSALPPSCRYVSREHFQNLSQELIERETSPLVLGYQEIVFKILGLVPVEYDYKRCAPQALFESVSAFYDAPRDTVYLPNDREIFQSTLWHEAVHAVQERQYRLSQLEALEGLFHDSAVALAAVFEGQAVRFVQEQELALRGGRASTPSPLSAECRLPEKLLRIFEAQYVLGYDFWANKRSTEYLTPLPYTSSEILDRGRSPSNRLPETFSLPTASEKHFHQGMGELMIRTILSGAVDELEARRAAKGWSFDRFHLYQHESGDLYGEWILTFAEAEDAAEFRTALAKTTLPLQSHGFPFTVHRVFTGHSNSVTVVYGLKRSH